MHRLLLGLSLLSSLLALPATGQTVTDGDTIRFGGRAVRLWGIDAAELHQRKAGTFAWSEAVVHAVQNAGKTEGHILRIELKY